MDIRYLNSFLTIYETGGFTKAADKLGYAQSTISNHIKILEEKFNSPLFESVSNRLVLTDKGKVLLKYSYKIIGLYEELECAIENENKTKFIRIGAVESIMNTYVLDAINKFSKNFPDIEIEIVQTITNKLYEMLRKNEIDIAFVFGKNHLDSDMTIDGFHTAKAVFFSSRNNPISKYNTVSLDDILKNPIILTGSNTFIENEFISILKERNKNHISPFKSQSSNIIIDMVSNNIAISLLPKYLIDINYRKNKLKILNVDDFNLDFNIFICHHKKKLLKPIHIEFIDYVIKSWK